MRKHFGYHGAAMLHVGSKIVTRGSAW